MSKINLADLTPFPPPSMTVTPEKYKELHACKRFRLEEEKLQKTIERLEKHPKVKKVEVTKEWLYVTTEELYWYDKTGQYRVWHGSYKVGFPLDVKVDYLRERPLAYSNHTRVDPYVIQYLSNQPKHPHVEGYDDSQYAPCGDMRMADIALAALDYESAFEFLLMFLETNQYLNGYLHTGDTGTGMNPRKSSVQKLVKGKWQVMKESPWYRRNFP